VVLNAAPAQRLSDELLALIDVLVVNQGELSIVADHQGRIAECLARIDVPCTVVTMGPQGSCAWSKGVFSNHPAFKVTAVDSTGAGDTFCGVLVAALSRGNELSQALRLASAAGALACTRFGAQSSIPTQAEVVDFIARHDSRTPL
jgi:ribokinase